MKTYDWISIGGGITGAALSYELAKKGFSVLLLEQHTTPLNATRCSYGGLAYWSGMTDITRQLCQEGKEIYRFLSQELDPDIQFKEVDLILTIDVDEEPKQIAANYSQVAVPPQLITISEACEMEPLLNPDAISGALTVKHGHINPELTTQAYTQAAIRAGAEIRIAKVSELVRENDRISGVKTATETYYSANVVVCAGGFSRLFLKENGIPIRIYFTHAEMIEIPPVDVRLRTLVMPAQLKRFQLEAGASISEFDRLWDRSGNEPVPSILDAGAVQFKNGSIRIGQISRTLTDADAKIDPEVSESAIRDRVGKILPAIGKLPGTWHHCLVAFSHNRMAVVGTIPGIEGVHIFSGFSNPLVFAPPLARRFANFVCQQKDPIIEQLSPLTL